MHLGVVGLGRMGQIVVERVLDAGHAVTAYDVDSEALEAASETNRV